MTLEVMTVENAGAGLTVAPEGRALWGSAVSVQTDIEFVILAPGGREDLFSDVTAGELVSMFICLSQ